MRWLILQKLEENLQVIDRNISNIAILGGSSQDPEVEILMQKFPESKITYLGIENPSNDNPWIFLDLNEPMYIEREFDLIVCAQVLEHVWNLEVAFKHIQKISHIGGFIWINCPASNIAHGSPNFFSAGYSPAYLEKNFENLGFGTISLGCLGSMRSYWATHLLRLWPTKREFNHPLLGYRISGQITIGKIVEMLRRTPGRILMLMWDKKINATIDYATETYYFGKRLTIK